MVADKRLQLKNHKKSFEILITQSRIKNYTISNANFFALILYTYIPIYNFVIILFTFKNVNKNETYDFYIYISSYDR